MKLLDWLNRRLGIIDPDPEVNRRLAAVDEDIDHRAEHVNWYLRRYRYLCGRDGCPYVGLPGEGGRIVTTDQDRRGTLPATAERRVPDGGAVPSGARPSSRPTRPAPAVDLPGTAMSAPLRSRARISDYAHDFHLFAPRWHEAYLDGYPPPPPVRYLVGYEPCECGARLLFDPSRPDAEPVVREADE